VNGALLLDAEGDLWLCDAVDEPASGPPTCAEPRLAVVNYPEGTSDFDPSSADATGLRVSGDISWLPRTQIFGEVRP
jgi:hypothetical protein